MLGLKAAFKIFIIVLWTLPVLLAQSIVMFFAKGQSAYIIPRIWHKGVCWMIGLEVEVCGTPVHDAQLIYISNHLSYLDIPVIGTILKASFIAKDDVAGWPVIGTLARLQQTAFISRSSNKAKKVANALDDMLKQGKSLILFPEGTSTLGISVLPFKSSLFSLALPKTGTPIAIQPFIIDLISVNNAPPTKASRDIYTWYDDMEFAPHIWIFFKNKGAKVRLTFLDVVTPPAGQDRKTLCLQVEEQIRSGLSVPSGL